MSTNTRVFALAYGRVRWILVAFGLGPRHARVELDADAIRVRMGWLFHVEAPRSAIHGAKRTRDWPWAIGVHTNLRGRWLVNGSAKNIVSMDVEPPAAGRLAAIPVTVRRLGMSLRDPDGFLAAMRSGGGAEAASSEGLGA